MNADKAATAAPNAAPSARQQPGKSNLNPSSSLIGDHLTNTSAAGHCPFRGDGGTTAESSNSRPMPSVDRSSSKRAAVTGNMDTFALKRVKLEHGLNPEGVSGPNAGTAGGIGMLGARDPWKLKQCEICREKKQTYEMIRINNGCSHAFCTICISNHIKAKVAERQVVPVPCLRLECADVVEFNVCVGLLPRDVLDVWDRALCESVILDAHKFYCPFKDCSAMLVNDSEDKIWECECPHCHRLFCAQCRVPWHANVPCPIL